MEVPEFLAETLGEYEKRRMGRRIGFGERPALLVVDMQRGFTDVDCPVASDLDSQVDSIAELLEIARGRGCPVLFSALAFSPDLSDAGAMRTKGSGMHLLARGGPWVDIDPRLTPVEGEAFFTKTAASCFFGTDLVARLTRQSIDTLIVTGCTTSGCVRATVVDASSYGLRTMVVEEAVGDRAMVPHFASLFDMDSKYADVIGLADTREYLRDYHHS